MKILTTFGEIFDNADWESFCTIKRYSPYTATKGLANMEIIVELTMEEAKKIGLLG